MTEPGHCKDLVTELPSGIHKATINPEDRALDVAFDPAVATEGDLRAYSRSFGPDLQERFQTCAWRLQGQSCETCAERLERRVEAHPGIRRAHISFSGGRVSVDYDPTRTTPEAVEKSVTASGLRVEPRSGGGEVEAAASKAEIVLTVLAGLFLFGGLAAEHLGDLSPWISGTCYLLAYLTGGYFGVISGFQSLRERVIDVDLLMVLAALGAAYVGAPFEGGMLLFLFALSNVLQSQAMDRSRKAIQALMKLRPTEVSIKEGSSYRVVPLEEATVGAIVRVRPGESIALDGLVLSGESSVDESSLTGESMPVSKQPGSAVFAGTLNQAGALEYRVSKRAADSTLARIISLVEDAQAQKARTQRFLEKAEQHYALGVILLTLGLIAVPPLLLGAEFASSFYRAMTVMVVASPCALVISTPAAFLSAIGGAARRGVLFKGGVHLERLAEIEVVAFDKTGTLTKGQPQVTAILPATAAPDDAAAQEALLRLAAAIEGHSEHPLARAIERAAAAKKLKVPEGRDFQALPGKGAVARVEGSTYTVASPGYFHSQGAALPPALAERMSGLEDQGQTLVLVGELDSTGRIRRVLGALALADELRPEASEVVQRLKRHGVRRVAMLTGDNARVAARIGEQAGVDEVFAQLLPEDKVRVVKQLSRLGPVAMVGDGVNDAPALASAHVGIAMGAAGTDVAMETADVVLMSSHLHQLEHALALAHQARRIVRQNLTFALGVIVVLVACALTIGIPLPLGVVGHEGSTVLVCLNGLRLLAFRVRS